jgi:hypothetical protein
MAESIAQHRWRQKHRFVKRQLTVMTRAEYSPDAARMLDDFALGYHRDRELHQA